MFRIKYDLLKCLHKECRSKKFSSSFYYNLACTLTASLDHDQFNIDAQTLPYCSSADQIAALLSRWSLSRFEQIEQTSPLRSKLLRSQPLVAIELIQHDLALRCNSDERLVDYFLVHRELHLDLAQREPKAMCRLAIEHLHRLSKHKRFLPDFIVEKRKRLFAKAPEEMIELIVLAGSHQPGAIKCQSRWDQSGCDLYGLRFPRSFSIAHRVQVFFALYEQCKWSINHLPQLLQLMLEEQKSNLFSLRQQSKWFFEIVVQQRIGQAEFLKKLLKQGNSDCLSFLVEYRDLSVPLSRHLLAQLEQNELVSAEKRLQFLRYEAMSPKLFAEFLSLFKELGADLNQRMRNYALLLQCAVSTAPDQLETVLQWLVQRLTNEQLIVIEHLLGKLSELDDRFYLKSLPNHLQRIEELVNLAFNHLQQSANTLKIILNFAVLLLKRAEFDRNEENRKKLQQFACRVIQRSVTRYLFSLTTHRLFQMLFCGHDDFLTSLLIASLDAHRSISSRRASRGRCLSEIALQRSGQRIGRTLATGLR